MVAAAAVGVGVLGYVMYKTIKKRAIDNLKVI